MALDAHAVGRALERGTSAAATATRSAVREHMLVAAGQLASGVGNFVFAVVVARLVAPERFAHFAVFMALYLLVNIPAASLTAGIALDPALAGRARRRFTLAGLGLGAGVVTVAGLVGDGLGIPPVLIGLLGTAPLGAALLALERGVLYGSGRHRWVAATLITEPIVRLAVGIAGALSFGAVGRQSESWPADMLLWAWPWQGGAPLARRKP